MTRANSLKDLYAQIEEICRHFNEIRTEASGIVATSQMPDAALHLNDVLQSTEEAAITILDAAIAINNLAETPGLDAALRDQIIAQVGLIFEASSFQDISGQRIKKVLTHLTDLEKQLVRLSEAARGKVEPKPKNHLLNGPALAAEAPSQAEVDQLFGVPGKEK